ncbi:MAG: lipopolysaccharide kinase InaA family protein [Candidatus Jettenia sp.]|nr:MAG: lipopolysaccharide kinase InaA family protein [Candidatus Jettenia sp.]
MLQKQKIPASFSIIRRGGTTILVRAGYKETILNIVFDTKPVHERYADTPNIKSGRGSYVSVPVTGYSGERLIIRDYRHGGLFGKLLGGIFCNKSRPFNEFSLHEYASQKGVLSAEVIAVTKRRVWGLFYKANFITKEISGAVDIAQFLKESSLLYIQESKKSIISALARSIRNMHDAGIYHADLHIKNILLKSDSRDEFTVYIIDLDKSVIFPTFPINERIKNLLRLDRSLEKIRWLTDKDAKKNRNNSFLKLHLKGGRDSMKQGFSDKKYQCDALISQDVAGEEIKAVSLGQKIKLISKTDRVRFLKMYLRYNNTLDRDWKACIRQYQSHHSLHKLWWQILGLSGK